MATSSKDDYDPILAGDIVQATKAKQRSFDVTNTPAQYLPKPDQAAPAAAPSPAGPVGRATQQLASQATPRPISLADAFPTGLGDGKKAIYAGVGANGEASFSSSPSSLNSIQTNFTAPNQPPEQRLTSLMTDGNVSQSGTARLDQAVNSPQQAYRPMSSFADVIAGAAQNPAAKQQANIAQEWRTPASGPQFAALGSSANVGDGIGAFSQSNAGDSALASTRFQRANDIREAGRDKDRLDLANAKLTRDSNFTVVADSSRRPTLADLRFDQQRQVDTQGMRDAVQGAQGQIDSRRQGQAADQQLRQASRLEDALNAATAPNATEEQRNAYRTLSDPLGTGSAKLRAIEADTAAKNARAQKDTALAAKADRNIRGLPAALQKLEDADVEAVGVTKTMSGALDKISSQISDGTLQLGVVDNISSTVRNAVGGSDEVSANYSSMLSTMEKLRNESLRLNKGTQTEGDADRAWNELFTNIRDPKIVQQRIKEINGYNNQAAALRGATINNRRANQGLDPLDVDGLLNGALQAASPSGAQAQPQQQAASSSPAQGAVYTITTDDQYARLPSGADYIDPQGNHRRKP
ncbi:hypothetical protein [Pseudomonas syringae]|uniref:hypothetical protein n=1 Tax=Pseudomonas syringae TaxID=317 RepID=UPI0013724742|nr:hypothetical protein [Pseudomonas syringae]NAS98248.1 hypothetical protein [Pseudomonas syringae pv. actinidifoliorum]NAT21586.1 hypothetical protein [Pseudomonas syringae pv. actinidifoliorum]NAT39460.1 hypothetical protein [Pseudomonas syringae pv. actinidifoliorum]NAT61817.1 hypothetical protein [Pseudomonas syringae pv. actinidifoliorum]